MDVHRYNIRNNKDTTVAKHSYSEEHTISDMFVYGVERIQYRSVRETTIMKTLETRWIFKMRTLQPVSLNVDLDCTGV